MIAGSVRTVKGGNMHTTIRTYETDAAQAREVTSLVEQHFAPKLERLDGFVAYQMITSPDGKLVTITTCKTPQACTESDKWAAEFVRDRLQQFQLNLTVAMSGQVRVSRAAGP